MEHFPPEWDRRHFKEEAEEEFSKIPDASKKATALDEYEAFNFGCRVLFPQSDTSSRRFRKYHD